MGDTDDDESDDAGDDHLYGLASRRPWRRLFTGVATLPLLALAAAVGGWVGLILALMFGAVLLAIAVEGGL